MIRITHPDLNKIEKEYTHGIVMAIAERRKKLHSVIKTIPLTIKGFKEFKPKENITEFSRIFNLNQRNRNVLWEAIKYKEISEIKERIRVIETCLNYLNNQILREFVSAQPDKQIQLQKDFFLNNPIDGKDAIISYLFDYNGFKEKHVYPIAGKLSISVCPYCNRNFITHITKANKRIIGPTFDHFFDQARYPLLSLNFYNLIPSCSICNSNLKNQKEFKLNNHLHPYLNEMGDNAKFNFELVVENINGKKTISYQPVLNVIANSDSEIYKQLEKSQDEEDSGSINVFKIREIYLSHADIIEELHHKFDKYSPHYLKSIAGTLKTMGKSEQEFYRYHFGNYFNASDFNKRPLAKFTKDIYDSLNKMEPFFD
jgi:hypothetical protein